MDRHLALQCFCRVVETGGFAAAARDLDYSPAMVTKYIQHLEEWTGSRLLARTTRRMQLTEAGERFYAYCRRVLDDTERTLGAIRAARDELSGRLVLAVPVSLTLAFLKDHLHAFQAAHPGIELELRLSDRPVNLVRDGIDVALRGQAQLDDSSLVAVPLMVLQRALAAAPDYWRQHGKPEHPSGLAAHNCLPYLLGSDATRWQFDGPGGPQTVAGLRQLPRGQQPDTDRRDAARRRRGIGSSRDDADRNRRGSAGDRAGRLACRVAQVVRHLPQPRAPAGAGAYAAALPEGAAGRGGRLSADLCSLRLPLVATGPAPARARSSPRGGPGSARRRARCSTLHALRRRRPAPCRRARAAGDLVHLHQAVEWFRRGPSWSS